MDKGDFDVCFLHAGCISGKGLSLSLSCRLSFLPSVSLSHPSPLPLSDRESNSVSQEDLLILDTLFLALLKDDQQKGMLASFFELNKHTPGCSKK